jgi:hypothetical protein
MFGGIFPVVPLLVLLIWLGLIIYALLLATRLVNAVEQIARSMASRLPGSAGG